MTPEGASPDGQAPERRSQQDRLSNYASFVLFAFMPLVIFTGLVSDELAARLLSLQPILLIVTVPSTLICLSYYGASIFDNYQITRRS